MEPEKLIGKKVKGFKFEDSMYIAEMDKLISKIGVVIKLEGEFIALDFGNDNIYLYPADQIEAHLVEEEIPTLSDGVMMLVSDDEKKWRKQKVFCKIGCYYITYDNFMIEIVMFAKPLEKEPTKEEQLKAILGSDDKVSEIMELFKN